MEEFDVDGADASKVLGYEGDGDNDNGDNDGNDGDDDNDGDNEGNQPGDEELSDDDSDKNTDAEGLGASRRECFGAFQQHVRVTAAKRAEGNGRTGRLQTQCAMVKAWEVH